MAEMLKVADAAGRLGVSVRTVYALVGAGKIPCYRVGLGRGAIRFGEGHLAEFLAGAERQKGLGNWSVRMKRPSAGRRDAGLGGPL